METTMKMYINRKTTALTSHTLAVVSRYELGPYLYGRQTVRLVEYPRNSKGELHELL